MEHTRTGTELIPDKLYFKIGEVSKIVGVDPHVLRYWESEFKNIRPQRASSKQRLYRRMDVESILKIKDLLYIRGFTIAGAKKVLKEEKASVGGSKQNKAQGKASRVTFEALKKELVDIKKILEKK